MTTGERPMRAALYARVSTADKQHPGAQLGPLREYVASRRWTVVDEFVDEGVSGVLVAAPARLGRRAAGRALASPRAMICSWTPSGDRAERWVVPTSADSSTRRKG